MKKVLLAIAVVAMLLGLSSAMAQKGNEGPTYAVSFVIIKDANEQPVRNAAVVMLKDLGTSIEEVIRKGT